MTTQANRHDGWTREWPTKPGAYWFYGWRWRLYQVKHYAEPSLHYVTASRDANNRIACVEGGHFMYKAETGDGMWKPVDLPTPPTDELAALEKEPTP